LIELIHSEFHRLSDLRAYGGFICKTFSRQPKYFDSSLDRSLSSESIEFGMKLEHN